MFDHGMFISVGLMLSQYTEEGLRYCIIRILGIVPQ